MRRVVITGLGIVAPNGIGKTAFTESILEGRSGVSRIESFDTSGHRIKIAGEIKSFDVSPYLGDQRKSEKVMSRAVKFAVGAASLAVTDCGLDMAKLAPERFGICMGTGITPMEIRELARPISESMDANGILDLGKYASAQAESIFPLWLLKHLPNMAAAHISIIHKAMGPNNTIVTACAAGTQAARRFG